MADHIIETAMRHAFDLARRGPEYGGNPQVGCVVLSPDGRELSSGYHHGTGTPHAEIDALHGLAPEQTRGCTLVVSLEPCRHYGHTGPCTKALIAAGVGRVYYSVPDPGEQSGHGADELRAAGIEVHGGILRAEGERLLHRWLTSMRSHRPYTIAKFATSLDGRGAAQDGSSQWISCRESRAHAHRLRATCDGIIVGTGTVLDDDPALTARHPDGSLYPHQPVPIVIGHRSLPAQARIFSGPHHPIFYNRQTPLQALSDLFDRGLRTVIVEGGPTLLSSFIGENLVDEFHVYLAPKLLGGWRLSVTQIGVRGIAEALQLRIADTFMVGEDIFIDAFPVATARIGAPPVCAAAAPAPAAPATTATGATGGEDS
jgi:diaminohydroxyphosphoribosylaminopyrimidine deaminase/5-amino-6-(5-phosphoribosylamino)uracil reductase